VKVVEVQFLCIVFKREGMVKVPWGEMVSFSKVGVAVIALYAKFTATKAERFSPVAFNVANTGGVRIEQERDGMPYLQV
jgi:hypothetical protein